MRYEGVVPAQFIHRPNRFIARVLLDGREETVHVKNTGRLRELLLPGAQVYLAPGANPARKTAYDLIAVRSASGALFNIDSQAPNRAVGEWLATLGFDRVLPEQRYGDSRVDFAMERDGIRYLMEVKGCTLIRDGVGYFPDAPTARGAKHLRELARAAGEGIRAAAAFVVQVDGVRTVLPNRAADPDFAAALREAASAGVAVLPLPCHVTPDSMCIDRPDESVMQWIGSR